MRQACDTLVGGRPEEALDLAFAAWQEARSPVLSELLDALDRACAPEPPGGAWPPGPAGAPGPGDDGESPCVDDLFALLRADAPAAVPAGADPADSHEAWLACARRRRPGDLRRLLATLVRPEEAAKERWAPLVLRLEALAAWPDDPRLGVLEALLERLPSASARAASVWRLVLDLVRRSGRGAGSRMGAADPEARFIARRSAAQQLDPELRAACEQLGELCGIDLGVRREEELLARIWADPADDGARLAYADWLAGHKDPWAELIRMDLRGPGKESEARRAELVRAHGRRFLGALAEVVTEPRFDRGLPCAGTLRTGIDREALAALAGRPEWTTYEELELGGSFAGWPPALRLRRASLVTPSDLLAMLAAPGAGERLERLSTTFAPAETDGDANRAFAELVRTRALPRLRALRLDCKHWQHSRDIARLRPLWSSPAGAGLTSLHCVERGPVIKHWLGELMQAPPALAEVVLEAHSWVFTITRDRVGDLGEVRVRGIGGRPDVDELSRCLHHVANSRLDALTLERPGTRYPAELIQRLKDRMPLEWLCFDVRGAVEAELDAWARPRVERFPTVIVRRVGGEPAQWTFQQQAMQVGELELAWLGCVLAWQRKGGEPQRVTSGKTLQVGEDRYEIEIEDVERIVAYDRPDLATAADLEARCRDSGVAAHANGDRLQLGEIVWEGGSVPRDVVDALTAALLAAARFLDAARSSPPADAAWMTTFLEQGLDRGRFSFFRDSEWDREFVVEDGVLSAGYTTEGWVTSHRLGPRFVRRVSLPVGVIPRDVAQAQALCRLLRAINSAAVSSRPAPIRRLGCRFCGQIFEPLHMHDRSTCHGCAEEYLGIIH